MSQAIHPLHQVQTRKTRRGFIREANRIEPYLADLETKFELSVFKAPPHLTYKELYDHFHDKWKDLVKHLILELELKYSMVDIHHFPRLYRSVV